MFGLLNFKRPEVSVFEEKSSKEKPVEENSVVKEKSFEERFKALYQEKVKPYGNKSFNLPLNIAIFPKENEVESIQKVIERARSEQLKKIEQPVMDGLRDFGKEKLVHFKLNYFLGDSETQTHVIEAQLNLMIYSADIDTANKLKAYQEDPSKEALEGFADKLHPHRDSIVVIAPLVEKPLNQACSDPGEYYSNLKEFCADAMERRGHPRETEIIRCALKENDSKRNSVKQKNNQRDSESSSSRSQNQRTLDPNNNASKETNNLDSEPTPSRIKLVVSDNRLAGSRFFGHDNPAFVDEDETQTVPVRQAAYSS
jgi:hypothetical protein